MLEDKVDANEAAFKAAIDERVDASDAALKDALIETESKLLREVRCQVKNIVQDELRQAGFDSDLPAADLRMISSSSSYPTVVASAKGTSQNGMEQPFEKTLTQAERREERFWECRGSLRLWPVPAATRESLNDYLTNKLHMDRNLVENMVITGIKKHVDPRSKTSDEITVVFETKEMRDTVKSKAHHLAGYKDNAGMRLHIPNYLQKYFRLLVKLAFIMKKKHPSLKRNVKFDEENLGLFMDIQASKDHPWRRVKPEQARAAIPASDLTTEPQVLDIQDLKGLLESDASE